MARLLRGEIRHARIESDTSVVGHEQGNPRPALIISNDAFNSSPLGLVIVALIGSSSSNENHPNARRIQSVSMPRNPSWVLTHQVRTLSAERMGHLYGRMSEAELLMVLRDIFSLLV